MAKTAIPYERVVEAAFQLRTDQKKITHRAVRAISGGSPSTVGQHLRKLEQEHPELFPGQGVPPPIPALSERLVRVLEEELRQRDAALGQPLTEQLAMARETQEDLQREVADLEEELARETTRWQRERDDLAGERDRLAGRCAQQVRELESKHQAAEAELHSLTQQLQAERDAVKTLQLQLGAVRLTAESQQKRAEELQQEWRQEREGRVEAERSRASASASLEELRKHLDQMIRLHDDLETARDALQQALDTERAEHRATAGQLAACQVEAKAAAARADDLQRREGELRAEFKERAEDLQRRADELRAEVKQRDLALEALRAAAAQDRRESGDRSPPQR